MKPVQPGMVIVRTDHSINRTDAGVWLPDSDGYNNHKRTGTVREVGPGCYSVKKGDRVYLPAYKTYLVHDGDGDRPPQLDILMYEEDIIGNVKDYGQPTEPSSK